MSELMDRMLNSVALPKFYRVKQHFPAGSIGKEELPEVLLAKLRCEEIRSRIRPGMSVAITAGSRGITNIALVTKTVVDFLKEMGAKPFIIPAMGSHGGATAEGQKEVIASYGITEEAMGCPIRATMEVTEIGKTDDGRPVVVDAYAAAADGTVLINRVKLHTGFRGKYESGLVKMMAIGLAKQEGAQNCHDAGFKNMAENIVRYGSAILQHGNILFGVATVENAYDETAEVVPLLPEEILEKEPELLVRAQKAMARIFVEDADLLIVDEIGKNYSGNGMDPNVTGTFSTPYASGGLRAKKVTILGLSSATHGNGFGIGNAESTTQEVMDQLDLEAMYMNGLTSKGCGEAHLPCILKNDSQAIRFALLGQDAMDYAKARIVRIPNSMNLSEIWLSEAYLEEIEKHPDMEIISGPAEFVFDEKGDLADRFRS